MFTNAYKTKSTSGYSNMDFIENNREKRTSRTKLHKIASNFHGTSTSSSNLLQPINFVHSPSHSPTSSSSNSSSSSAKKCQLNETASKFSNELYDAPDLAKLTPIFCNQTASTNSSSSLLLMIPSQTNKTVIKKLSKSSKCKQLNAKVSAKSMSNLSENSNASTLLLTVPSQLPDRRQSIQTYSQQQSQPQYKNVNSSTIQICSKFYDKSSSNFNVIGEQETLV